MKISAIYIAKNEAHCIEKSLSSLVNSVDELILVDTGSTDNTKEIFRSYGGIVFDMPWGDDFSLPRNYAISKATGDWLILLDADEYFSADTANNLRQVIEDNKNAEGLLIVKSNINKDTGEELDKFFDLRAVRNQQGLCYKGRIHEELLINGNGFKKLLPVDVSLLKIIHTGYTPSIASDKAKRNLSILLEEIKNGRPEEELYTYLAECYEGIGDIPQMLMYAEKDVARGRTNATYASRSYRKLIAYYATHGTKLKRLDLLKRAVNDFPELPEFHAELAQSYIQCYEYDRAVKELEYAIQKFINYKSLEPCLLDQSALNVMHRQLKKINNLSEGANFLKITACVICKNEEKNIKEWIKNVEQFADEIIVVDTGSVDNTVEIAKKMAVRLFHYEWNDDFSSAKNYALDKAKGDWIVFTDADELFYNPERVRGFILNMSLQDNMDAAMIPLVNVDESCNFTEGYRFNAIRIFKRSNDIRYFGKIHESLSKVYAEGDSGSLNIINAGEELLIRHTGYSKDKINEKLSRNLRMLEKDIEINGMKQQYNFYLAECYFGMEKYKLALKYSFLAMDSCMQPIGQENNMYWIAAECLNELKYSFEERSVLLDLAIEKFSEMPDFYALKGLLLLEKSVSNISDAKKILELSITIAKSYTGATYYTGILDKVYIALGKCYLIDNDISKAREYFRMALDVNKWHEEALMGLADTYDLEPANELMTELQRRFNFKNNKLDKNMLCNILVVNGGINIAEKISDSAKNAYNMINLDRGINYINSEIELYLKLYVIALMGNKLDDMNPVIKQQMKLLPEALKRLVLAYHNKLEGGLNNDDYEYYKIMLDAIFNQPDVELKYNFIIMANYFSVENILEIAKKAVCNDMWEAAYELYKNIPANAVENNGSFWLNVGMCFYYMRNIPATIECLEKAVEMNLEVDDDNQARAYLQWCQEAMA